MAEGVLQPAFGMYAPGALPVLRAAEPDAPLTRTVEMLDPGRVALPGALVRSVNTPEDLAEADELCEGPDLAGGSSFAASRGPLAAAPLVRSRRALALTRSA